MTVTTLRQLMESLDHSVDDDDDNNNNDDDNDNNNDDDNDEDNDNDNDNNNNSNDNRNTLLYLVEVSQLQLNNLISVIGPLISFDCLVVTAMLLTRFCKI